MGRGFIVCIFRAQRNARALMADLVCFGFGYCAEHFVAEFGDKFNRIVATVRGAERAAVLNAYEAGPLEAVVFDGAHATPVLRDAIVQARCALVSIPPGDGGDPVLAVLGDDLAAAKNLGSIVYLSTVGVYGDHGGGWVDEQTPVAPVSARSRRRLAATAPDRMRSSKSRAAKHTASSNRARFSRASTSAISRRRSTPHSRAAHPEYSMSSTTNPPPPPIRSSSARCFWVARRRRKKNSMTSRRRCRRWR